MLGSDGKIRWTRRIAELAEDPKAEPFGAVLIQGKIHLLLGVGRRHSKRTLEHARLNPKTGQVEARHRLVR